MNKKDQIQDHSRIFFLCPDIKEPLGTNRSNYRLVDILNRNTFNAFVLHSQEGFRCQWFQNNTKVAYISKIKFTKKDYLAIPEFYGPDILNFDKLVTMFGRHVLNIKRNFVIVNRNCYHTFGHYPILDKVDVLPYSSTDLLGVIVISEDSKNYLQYVFPKLRIFRVFNSIDPKIFSYNSNKKKKICFMNRKLESHIREVINILRYRGVLKEFELVPIEGKTIEETAAIMNESLIFLSFSYQEGFGNPPAEAMLSGCVVVGYHGRGGKEYFNPEFLYPIEFGDVIGFARAVEKVIEKYNVDPSYFISFTKKASDYIKENYSPDKQESEVVNCWKSLMNLQPTLDRTSY